VADPSPLEIPSPTTPRLLRKSRGAKFAARRLRSRVRDVWKCRIVQRNVKQMIGSTQETLQEGTERSLIVWRGLEMDDISLGAFDNFNFHM
jgi:hypothetical protein